MFLREENATQRAFGKQRCKTPKTQDRFSWGKHVTTAIFTLIHGVLSCDVDVWWNVALQLTILTWH